MSLDTEITIRKTEVVPRYLNYVSLSVWEHPKSPSSAYSVTAFVYGYETPRTAMPNTGTGEFGGVADGVVLKPVEGVIRETYLHGDANFVVDFASGKITGEFTKMQEYPFGPGAVPWNDVSVSASISGPTNRFSGTASAGPKPNTTFGLSGSATGHIDGAFYGPNAEQLGAVWSLSDGTGSALGTAGALREWPLSR